MPAIGQMVLRFPATITDSQLVQEESLVNKNEIAEKHRRERAMLFFCVESCYVHYAEKQRRDEVKGERKIENRRKGKIANTCLSPFVFAPQMEMQAFSLEAWCKS